MCHHVVIDGELACYKCGEVDPFRSDGKKPLSDLGRFLFGQANAMNQQLQNGLTIGQQHAAQDLRSLFTAYDRAKNDREARIPTILHIAIETLRKKYAP